MTGVAALAALALAAAALGRALTGAVAGPAAWNGRRRTRSRAGDWGWGWGWASDTVGGLAALHLLMLGLDLAGVRWSRGTLAAAWLLAVAAAGAVAWRRRRPMGARPAAATHRAGGDAEHARRAGRAGWGVAGWGVAGWGPLGWGDLLAAAVCALYAGLAWSLWIAIPDFVYHWGVKGRRYHLAGGIDWEFLADPLRLAQHPDYPNLLPDLYAAVATIAGRFDERPLMLLSALLFALLLVAADEPWRRLGTRAAARQAGIVAVAAAAGAFGIGYRLAGGGEWNLALALTLALPPILAPAGEGRCGGASADDLRLGYAAAFAAGSKMEGLPLAAILIAIHLARRTRAGGVHGFGRAVAATALPAALVVVPWLWGNLRYGLFSATHPGAGSGGGWLDPERAAAVAAAVVAAFGTAEWHGLAWLLPPLLLALALSRRTRPAALAVALQLGFYLWVYLASPLEPRFYVLSSLPRLLFHLLPAILVAAVGLAGSRRTPLNRQPDRST